MITLIGYVYISVYAVELVIAAVVVVLLAGKVTGLIK